MNLQGGLGGLEDLRQFGPDMRRQDEVGEEEVDLPAVFLPDAKGAGPVGGFEHLVPWLLQDMMHELEQRPSSSTTRMVSVPPMTRAARRGQVEVAALFVAARQKDLERGAFIDAAGDGDPALVLLDDAIDGGQAQPVPRSSSLVVKKGSKIRGRFAGSMPLPVSPKVRQTNGVLASGFCGHNLRR